jgi:DnaJ family protein B protein 4
MAFLVASVVDQMEEEELLPTVILASSSTTHNNNSMLAGRPAPVETKLLCTLEELYKGSVRKMKISRNLADPSRNTLPVEEILTIKVKADWKKGTKVTFRQKGTELKTR